MDIQERRYKLLQLLQSNNWRAWVQSIYEYHCLSQELYGIAEPGRTKKGWSMRDTAESLKRSLTSIQTDLALAKALKDGEKFEGCDNREAATIALKEITVRNGNREDVRNSQV